MTYRERRQRRADRLRGWSETNEKKAAAEYESARARADVIPFGQPILVGHHSEKADRSYRSKIDRSMERSFEQSRKAEDQASRAANIEAQDAHAIYSDDEDAVERLEERIATLEAERDRWKAYNASCKAGAPDESVLDDRQRASVDSTRRYSPYQLGKNGTVSYANLTANINRQRKRLVQVRADAQARESGQRTGGRMMQSRFESECADCGKTIEKGSVIVYFRSTREAIHGDCSKGGGEQ